MKNKKIISLLLSLVMIMSAFTVVDLSAYAVENSGKCGNNVNYTFNSSTGKLTIYGSGDMYSADDYFDYDMFSYDEDIKTVEIQNGVTSIRDLAFLGCNNLTNVTIPSSVKTIEGCAFQDCTSLKSIVIPNSVKTIGGFAFAGCSNLTKITLSNNLEDIAYFTFQDCTSLTNVVIPNGVIRIWNNAFENCTNLTSVTIPNSVTDIWDEAFIGCKNLKDIYFGGTLSEWNDAIEYREKNDDLKQVTVHCHTHSYNNGIVTTKATSSSNGYITYTCAICGATKTSTISKISSAKLSATSYTYNGNTKTPTVTVKDSKGKTLKSGTDYTVSYASGRKYVGKYSVKITFKGKYSGTKTLYFTINPKATAISSISAGAKKFTVKWSKVTAQTTGYQIQYATNSKFSSAKTVTVSKNTTTSNAISKLSAKKKYYVRIRTYKTVNGTKYYSSWSKAKTVTTK